MPDKKSDNAKSLDEKASASKPKKIKDTTTKSLNTKKVSKVDTSTSLIETDKPDEHIDTTSQVVQPTCKITKETYGLLVSNISALFLYDQTIALIKQDETFQNVVRDYINAIYTYEENNKVVDEQIDNFLIAYKTVVGTPYDPILINNTTADDLDDKISYLNVYIRNTLKTEWADVLASFKQDTKKIDPDSLVNMAAVAGTASVINNAMPNNTGDGQTNQNPQNQANYTQSDRPFNSEEFLKQNNVNFDQMAEMAILGHARAYLYSKILKNEYFVFDSKPSFFVWNKWLYLFGTILFGILILATFIFQTIPMFNIFVYTNTIPGNLNTRTAAVLWLRNNSNFSFTQYGMNSTIIYIMLNIFLACMIGLNMVKFGWKEIKFRNNDNYRFSCSFTPFFYLLIGLMALYLFPMIQNTTQPLAWFSKLDAYRDFSGSITIPGDTAIKADPVTLQINNAAAYGTMYALSMMHILLLVFAGITIIASLGIKLIAPKKNFEAISNTIVEIVGNIKANRIDLNKLSEQFTPMQTKFNDMRRFL